MNLPSKNNSSKRDLCRCFNFIPPQLVWFDLQNGMYSSATAQPINNTHEFDFVKQKQTHFVLNETKSECWNKKKTKFALDKNKQWKFTRQTYDSAVNLSEKKTCNTRAKFYVNRKKTHWIGALDENSLLNSDGWKRNSRWKRITTHQKCR